VIERTTVELIHKKEAERLLELVGYILRSISRLAKSRQRFVSP
jgi:hypothetical protein